MIDHYNAFISYRHSPLDMKIASNIQRKLEHFHIPHKIRSKTGHKRIQRIFRDKDELPITSSLNDTISNALDKADYLIVICSTHTNESMWVKREIAYFLEHHTRDKILTVLCDGEPDQVIPEELLFEEREVVGTDGEKHNIRVPLEPLSCDYRIPMKEADKVELPRLAAALIGCSYDELMRRRRQYRIRRLSIIFAAALAASLAFGGYMLVTNKRINDSLNEAMYRKALYLANESDRLNDEDERLEAIQLALASLPNDDNRKLPVTAQSVKALTDATYAYKPKKGTTDISAVWNFTLPGTIMKMDVSKDGSHLAACDDAGNFVLWKTKDHSRIFETDKSPQNFCFTEDGKTILLISSDSVTALNAKDGEEKWVWFPSDDESIYTYYSMSEKQIFVKSTFHLYKIDLKDGDSETVELKRAMDLSPVFYVSPDGKNIVFEDIYSTEGVHLISADVGSSEEYKESEEAYGRICQIEWIDSDHFVAAISDEQEYLFGYSYDSITEHDLRLVCFNAKDMSVSWETTLKFNLMNLENTGLLYMPSREAVAFYAGETLKIVSKDNGEVLDSYSCCDTIVSMADTGDNGYPVYVTSNGNLGFTGQTAGYSLVVPGLVTDISYAQIAKGVYVHRYLSNDIIYYASYVYDESFEQIGEEYSSLPWIYTTFDNDKYMAVLSHRDGECCISFIDLETGKETECITPETDDYKIDDFGAIGDDFYYLGEEGYDLLVFKLKDDKFVEKERIKNEVYTNYYPLIDADKVWYYEKDDNNLLLCSYDVEKDKTKKIEVADSDKYVTGSPVIVADGKYAIINLKEEQYIFDVEKGEKIKLRVLSDMGNIVTAEASSDGMIAMTDGNEVVIFTPGEKDSVTINCDGQDANGLFFVDDDTLIVSYGNGKIGKYNAKTGELQKFAEVKSESNSMVVKRFNLIDDYLYVSGGTVLSMIDMESFYCIADVEYGLYYNQASDRFYTFSYESETHCVLGYYQRYSLDALIERAHELIGTEELSPEKKSIYGL